MPVISFNKKYLYGLIGGDIDDQKFAEQMSKLGFEVDHADSGSVSVEITANRLDLLDAVGLARALKNFAHRSKRFRYEIRSAEPAMEISVDGSVKAVRPFIASLVALGVRLDEQATANLVNFSEKFCETYGRDRRKVAIGLHDLDTVKPPVSYRAGGDEEYVPLGGTKPMKLSEVLQEEEKGRKYSGTVVRKGRSFYPVLSDSEGVMAFIPILNSQRTRITAATRNVLVDVTGTSEYAVNKAAEVLAATFMDMGADVRRVRIAGRRKRVDTPEMSARQISIPISKAEREIGVEIGYNNVISLANKMGYEAAMVGNRINFRVPEYRMDVIDRQDVIEDIAIAYGYQYIDPLPIFQSQPGVLEQRTRANRRLSEMAVGLGFSEFTNSYLTNQDSNFRRPGIEDDGTGILLRNSKTEAITMMRTWIIPSLLNNLGMSASEKMPQDAFELDMVFRARNRRPVEAYHIAAVSVGPRKNFNDIKAVVEGLLGAIGAKYGIREYSHGAFIPGRCAEITLEGRGAGFFGELHPRALKNFGIEEPGVAFEIDLESFYPKS